MPFAAGIGALPGCPPPVFPAQLYPLFQDGYCNPGFYAPPPPMDMPPPPTTVVLAPPPPAPVPVANQQPIHEVEEVQEPTFRFAQLPVPPPVVLDEYPPVIVLKTGGVYSAAKYWTKGNTLYFTTPGGETYRTPAATLERIYPRIKSVPPTSP
jgi:hypothetical protein